MAEGEVGGNKNKPQRAHVQGHSGGDKVNIKSMRDAFLLRNPAAHRCEGMSGGVAPGALLDTGCVSLKRAGAGSMSLISLTRKTRIPRAGSLSFEHSGKHRLH